MRQKNASNAPFRLGLAAASLVALLGQTSRARADYPLVSHRYLADPGALVSGGRIYLYNSNDDDNAVEGGYAMKSIVCVSSSDLKNWTDHGEVFRVPANAAWAGYSWAPAAVERNGKIFLYFGNNANGVGVASSTSPTGPFTDAKGSALVSSSTPGASGTDSWLFDPSAFVDDDGQAYLTFGGNGDNNARVIKLNSDMVSVSGSAIALSVQNFFEASWMYKRNGIYYFTYSTNSAAGLRIDYLMSTSPTSGFTYGGVAADQPPSNGNNNHHSIFEFNDKWYHAYHNRIVATQAGIATTYKRNLGIESIDYDADGKIQQVKYTADGLTQLASLAPYVRVEAETTNAQKGIETEPCMEGGMDVTDIDDGDWIKVRGVDFGSSGAKSFTARVASAAAGGSIELRLDSATGALIGTCTVPATGGAQTWMSTTCDVTGATGTHDLYLQFGGGNFALNYWQFTAVDGGSGGSAGGGGVAGSSGSAGSGFGGVAGSGVAGGGVAGSGGTAISGSGGLAGGSGGTASGVGGVAGGSGGTGGSSTNGGSVNGGVGGAAGRGSAGASVSAGGTLNGVGGSTPGSAGASGATGGSAAKDSGGCGCFVGAGPTSPGAPLALLVAMASALRWRKRRTVRLQRT